MQALLAGPELPAAVSDALRRGYHFLCAVQMHEEIPAYQDQWRDSALGGWCFSDGVHRWPVSDCTAEALCAIFACHQRAALIPDGERLAHERTQQAAAFILGRQNCDGGFGTYERRRGSLLLEAVNPSEMYGSCMTERSYVECTGSCVCALSHFRDAYPNLLAEHIRDAIAAAVAFLRHSQRCDGSWPGFWGVNFTYAIFHAVKGLRAAGVPATDPCLRGARFMAGTHPAS